MQTTIKFNYQDYLQLPEDKRYEIIDGELFMVPSLMKHISILLTLTTILFNYVKKISLVLFIARRLMYYFQKKILSSLTLSLYPTKTERLLLRIILKVHLIYLLRYCRRVRLKEIWD